MTKTKKSHWGIGIAVVYGAFMLIMVGFVVASRFQRSDLVARDYYEQEVKYQEQIDRLKRTAELGHQISAAYDRHTDNIVVTYPLGLTREHVTGTILMFRPANAAYDRSYDISLDQQYRQLINCDRLPRGAWKLKFLWQLGADELYSELNIDLE
jgi:nitrogen fixation protein FixH